MASPRTLIIIPTYNELENISKMVSAVMDLRQGYHILFIDDNSPDGTAAQIEALMEKHPAVFLEKRPGKLGLGTAYIHALNGRLAVTTPTSSKWTATFLITQLTSRA